jgi:hypothetical protein
LYCDVKKLSVSDLEEIAAKLLPSFSGDESTSEITQLMATIPNGDPDLDLVSEDIQIIAKTIRSQFPTAQRLPKLIASWGIAPEIGNRCGPQFLLICGEDYSDAELDVVFELDDQLDFKAADTKPTPIRNSEGHWIFRFPFNLTTNGSDCLAGMYNMKVELEFAGLADSLLPQHLYCDIRLTIPKADSSQRVLEIDSDDKSLVNLQGLNLRSFSKVKLKGSGSGLINILQGQESESDEDIGDSVEDDITQSYTLQIGSKDEVDKLWQSTHITERVNLQKACLRLPGGGNVVLLSQHRIGLGRSRDTDIVVRFLPRSDDNDAKSRNLSRLHCVATILESGIEFQDKSSSGIELNWEPVKETFTLNRESFHTETHFAMGGMLSSKQLELQFVPLVSESHTAVYQKERFRLESFAKSSHLRWGKLWSVAHQLKLDAIRIERENNLKEEQYVVICQQATIGSSDSKCAIVVKGLPSIAARLLYINRSFWLNKTTGDWEVSVDGHSLAMNEMVPLSPKHEIVIDGVKMTFEAHAQLHL